MKNAPIDSMRIGTTLISKAHSATVNGTAVNCTGCEYAAIAVNFGVLAGTATGSLVIEVSPNGSSGWVALTGGSYTINVTDDDDTTKRFHVRLDKEAGQYVRVTLVYGGSSTLVLGAIVIGTNLARQTDFVADSYAIDI
jgi:hypothetical protein